MQIDLYSATGSKVKAITLPSSLFEAPVNWGLMHQALRLQQNNRRRSTAHTKSRAEVVGSTKKLFAQKHTGRARRGPVRSPVLRGGGKAFGSKKDMNYVLDMPKQMRRAALRSCLSIQAQKGAILALEDFAETIKTKTMFSLLKKLPIETGRRILFVTPVIHKSLELSSRNITGVKTITASYLNPEDILNARHVIFLADAISKAEALFGSPAAKKVKTPKTEEPAGEKPAKKPATKKPAAKKPAARKSSPKKSS